MNIDEQVDPLVTKVVHDVVEVGELIKTNKLEAADLTLLDAKMALNSILNLLNRKART